MPRHTLFWAKFGEGLAISDPLKDLLNRMMNIDPTQRARMIDVVNHPWLSGGQEEISDEEFKADMDSRKE